MDKWMSHPNGGVMKVSNSLQEESALLHGWAYCDAPGAQSIPEPVAEPVEQPQSAGERVYLAERARRLGIMVDGRWGVKRLREEIEAVESL